MILELIFVVGRVSHTIKFCMSKESFYVVRSQENIVYSKNLNMIYVSPL